MLNVSEGHAVAEKEEARAALNVTGKAPEGCVHFLVVKAVHIARVDIPGYGDVEGPSVEVLPVLRR